MTALVTLALLFNVSTSAYASDGVCGPGEYTYVQQGWTREAVQRSWDNVGVRVDHWYTTNPNHEYMQKRYPTTGFADYVLATYVAAGVDANLNPIWKLTQKYTCNATCVPYW